MKTPIYYRWAVLITLSLIAITGCQPEKPTQEPTPAVPAAEPLNKYEEIVACTAPLINVLMVAEGQEENVLKTLGARKEGEIYTMDAANTRGDSTKYQFKIVITTKENIFAFCNAVDDIAAEAELAGREADEDTTRGEFINTFQSKGIFYRVYKNAQCSGVGLAYETNCLKEVRRFGFVIKETGKFVKKKDYAASVCVKGKDFCVEALRVKQETRVYDNGNCEGAPLQTYVSKYAFTCTK